LGDINPTHSPSPLPLFLTERERERKTHGVFPFSFVSFAVVLFTSSSSLRALPKYKENKMSKKKKKSEEPKSLLVPLFLSYYYFLLPLLMASQRRRGGPRDIRTEYGIDDDIYGPVPSLC
jgi:hypothetical protein